MGKHGVHVDLAIDNRDASLGGQIGLMKSGMKMETDYQMVDVYDGEDDVGTNPLHRFSSSINSEEGGFHWIVGNRGSGKSEVINHLFTNLVKIYSTDKNKESGKQQIPRLPLYISAGSGGEAFDETLSFPRIERLASESLLEALKFIHKTKDKNDHYPILRRFLNQFMDNIDLDLTKTIEGLSDGVTLTEFAETVKKHSRKMVRITLFVDDLDKIDNATARQFLSSAQQDLQRLASAGVTVVFSVKKDFALEVREDVDLSYCGLFKWEDNPSKILQVPDMGDLGASLIHQLISRRLHYIHHVNSEAVDWSVSLYEPPHKDISEVLDHEQWNSYDIRNLRRNGSIVTLCAWLSVRKKPYTRDALRAMERILNSCEESHRKKELRPSDIERVLKKHDVEERYQIYAELERRFTDATSKNMGKPKNVISLQGKLDKELSLLKSKNGQALLEDALEITNEAVTFNGAWNSKLIQDLNVGINGPTDDKSVIMTVMRFVLEMATDETLLPDVVARTPDDLLSLIDSKKLVKLIDDQSQRLEEHRLSLNIPDTLDYTGSILQQAAQAVEVNFPSVTLKDPGLAPRQLDEAADMFSLEIASGIMGNPDRRTKEWQDCENAQEDDPRQFRRSLLTYIFLRLNNPINGNAKMTDEDLQYLRDFTIDLNSALSGGAGITEFLRSENFERYDETLENVLKKKEVWLMEDWAEYVLRNTRRDFRSGLMATSLFDMEVDVKKLKSKELTGSTLRSNLKLTQDITFRVRLRKDALIGSLDEEETLLEEVGEVADLLYESNDTQKVLSGFHDDNISTIMSSMEQNFGVRSASASEIHTRQLVTLLKHLRFWVTEAHTRLFSDLSLEEAEDPFPINPVLSSIIPISSPDLFNLFRLKLVIDTGTHQETEEFHHLTGNLSEPIFRAPTGTSIDSKGRQTIRYQIYHRFNEFQSVTINPGSIHIPRYQHLLDEVEEMRKGYL